MQVLTETTTPEVLSRRARELSELMGVVAEAVAADGGVATLRSADLEAGVVEVALSGACSACALTSATLEQGIVRVITQRLGWVREVRTAVEKVDDLAAAAAMGRGGFRARDGVAP